MPFNNTSFERTFWIWSDRIWKKTSRKTLIRLYHVLNYRRQSGNIVCIYLYIFLRKTLQNIKLRLNDNYVWIFPFSWTHLCTLVTTSPCSKAYSELSFHGNPTVTRMNIAFPSLLRISFTGCCCTSTKPPPDTSPTSYGALVPGPVVWPTALNWSLGIPC